MTVDEAVDVIARHYLATCAAKVEWEDYDEVGEYDWEAVVKRLDQIAPYPENFGEALKVLTARPNDGRDMTTEKEH